MSADVNADTTYAINQKLRAEIEELRRKLAEQQALFVRYRDFVENAPVSAGVCCCGDSMDRHNNADHSAVDMWDNAINGWADEIAKSGMQELDAQIYAAKQEGREQYKQAGRDEVLRELSEQTPVAWRITNSARDGLYSQEDFTDMSFDYGRFDALIIRPSAPEKGEK